MGKEVAETIYMIHGMGGGPWWWDYYRPYFENEGYRCLPTTLRYHERDPREAPHPRLGTTSLLEYMDDLEREIQELDEKPIIMGHSLGGLLAQKLGSRGLAKALVLLSPIWPAGIMAIKLSVIRSFWSVLTTWRFWRKPVRQTFSEAVYGMLSNLSPAEQRDTFEKFVDESGRAVAEVSFWFLDSRAASHVDEAKVNCPVLIIEGAEDRVTPASVVRKVAEKYKAVCTYKEFEGHGHWVIAEPGWQDIARYAKDWLERELVEQP